MKSFAIIAMLVFFASQSQGAVGGGGINYFSLGGSIIDIKALNSRMESKGYSPLSDNFISLGIGDHWVIDDRVIIDAEGHLLLDKETTSGNYISSIDAGYGFLNLGYIIYSTSNLNVYPLLGLGGGMMSLKITKKGSLSFDDILDNPGRMTDVATLGYLLNLAIGTTYYLSELGGQEDGLVFGLRIGYTFAPSKGD